MEQENSWVDFTITRGPIRGKDRNRIGLIVKVKARKEVEDFMGGLAQGRTLPVDAVGDNWLSLGVDGDPLSFYEIDTRFENQRAYTLDQVAGPLLIAPANERQVLKTQAEEVVNLSFLRLAGISGDTGVSVGIVGPYSNDYLKRLKLALPGAISQFLRDYVAPVTYNFQIISKS